MDYRTFALTLLAETLFYDSEYGIIGSVSLIDTSERKERFVASYDPEEEAYLVEEATAWEENPSDPDDDVGYLFAADGRIVHRLETSEETAEQLCRLAEKHELQPVFVPLIEEEG